ncbi:Lrp/AsnC family transcriptional regulator [archaeon]|nr:Lrp/AsnC family transcriptional regulator [archaeon]
MDHKDRKLLFLLDTNSREKESILAKRMIASKQVVEYRIKRLWKSGIIKSFQTMINLTSLDIPLWAHVYFKLNASKEREKEIIEYLMRNRKVAYIAFLGGRFDMSIVILERNLQKLESLLDDIVSKYPDELKDHMISLRTLGWKFTKKYLIDKEYGIKQQKNILVEDRGKIEIDEIDRKILRELTKNSRIRILEIGRKLSIPFSTVRSRIKLLENNGVISGYSILIDFKKIDYNNYKIFIKTKDNSPKAFRQLFGFVSIHPNITYLMKTLGDHNYELRVEVENQEKYQEIVKDLRSKFSNIIQEVESIIVFEELKEDFSVLLEI